MCVGEDKREREGTFVFSKTKKVDLKEGLRKGIFKRKK